MDFIVLTKGLKMIKMQIVQSLCAGETGQVDGTVYHAEKDKYYRRSPSAICKTHTHTIRIKQHMPSVPSAAPCTVQTEPLTQSCHLSIDTGLTAGPLHVQRVALSLTLALNPTNQSQEFLRSLDLSHTST